MDTKFKWHMLITSFIPLWASIAVIILWDIYKYPYLSNITLLREKCIGLIFLFLIVTATLISVCSLACFFKTKSNEKGNSDVATIIDAKKSKKLVSDFLLVYVLPMIAFDFTNSQGIILFVIYFAVIAFLNIRNNNVYTNIYLEFKQYRAYKCNIKKTVAGRSISRSECTVFSKRDLITQIDKEMACFGFDNDVFIDLSHIDKGVKS